MSAAKVFADHPPFPEEDVISILRDWFESEAPEESKEDPNTLYAIPIALDSLRVVSILLTLEEKMDFEIPISVIKRGGYRSSTEMLEHLVPRIRNAYEKAKKIS